jgi:hypothetical protein
MWQLANILRLNYVLWIQDLIDTTGDEYRDLYDPKRDVLALDMWVTNSVSSAAREADCSRLKIQRNRIELYISSPGMLSKTLMEICCNGYPSALA